MVKFYKAAIGRGIKPIIGADVWTTAATDAPDHYPMTLLCTDLRGFKNLSRLLTRGYSSAQASGRALLLDEWLTHDTLEGLIGLSGAARGDVGRAIAAGRMARAREMLDAWLARMPGRFYLECQRLGRPGEAEYLDGAVQLA